MAGDYGVKVTVETEDKASGPLSSITSKFASFGSFLKNSFVITAGDVQRAVTRIIDVFGDWIRAAEDAEDANRALSDALAPLGRAAEGVAEGLVAQSDALQKTTRFSDEAIQKGQALLATFIKNESQLKRSTLAAADLATVMGVNLQTAFSVLARASQGSVDQLARYGISIDESLPKTERFSAILDQLAETMGGRAVASAKTYSGQLAILGNSLDELGEAAGKGVTGSESLLEIFGKINTLLQDEVIKRSIEDISAAVIEFGSAAVLTGIDLLILAFKELKRASDDLAFIPDTLNGIKGALDNAGTSINTFANENLLKLNKFLLDLIPSSRTLIDTTKELAAANEAAAAAADIRAAGEERLAAILRAEGESFDSLAEAAKRLGVKLEATTNKELERNAALLLEARDAAHQGVITWSDYEKILNAVNLANSKLDGTFKETDKSTKGLTESLKDQANKLNDVTNAANRTATALTNVIRVQNTGGGGRVVTTSGGPPPESAGFGGNRRYIGFSTMGGRTQQFYGYRN